KIFEDKNNYIPDEYKNDIKIMIDYNAYKRKGGWRNLKLVKLILMKAAKKIALNNERKNKS
ncbi:unnamed protein product, partial [marine sediment metagenome]